PQPPDTFFAKVVSGAYDICVAMYHDQGHIPVKIKGFQYDAAKKSWTSVNGINVSLGLPIIRTSVDHGTAFDQAGKGTASDSRLLRATRAAQIVESLVEGVSGDEFDLIYKKTDSAMRGQILAEARALLRKLGFSGALLVAQNPSRGRVIVDGEYRINDVP